MDVAVRGAGERGRDVARVAAAAGHAVALYDDNANAAMDAIDAIEGRVSDAATVDRLTATTGLESAVADADVAVETATADGTALRERLAAVEDAADREALLAVVTDVSVTAAAAGLRHPDRAVGVRFRSLAEAPLVEVVVADQTTAATCERAQSFVAGLDRSPVVVRDAPGGASARLALALEAEAMRLVDAGVAGVAAVDEALVLGYGHPAGPLEQADRAGLDDRLADLEELASAVGERFAPPDVLRERVADGATGRAAGEGFYRWEDGEPVEPAVPDPDLPRSDDGPEDPRA
jgi:3-hydroxybutyryl-CoA dehydrogenase